MGSISKTVEKIIVTSPFLEEALAEKLINVSSLARKIRQEVEDSMGEPIKEGAIVNDQEIDENNNKGGYVIDVNGI